MKDEDFGSCDVTDCGRDAWVVWENGGRRCLHHITSRVDRFPESMYESTEKFCRPRTNDGKPK